MDSFELNKIIAAILMVGLLLIGIGKISKIIFHVEKPEKPGYAVEVEKVVSASSISTEVTKEEVDKSIEIIKKVCFEIHPDILIDNK